MHAFIADDDLLDTSFDLTDKEGILTAKMKIVLSRTSGSDDNIEEFMKKVDDDVSPMSSLPSNLSTLGQVLQITKAIMDQFSQVVHLSSINLIMAADRGDQVHPILNASWTLVSIVYQVSHYSMKI
jgi:hypothetical protein